MALHLKRSTLDPMLIKPQCVWEALYLFTISSSLFTISKKIYCFSNLLWLYQHRYKCAKIQLYSLLLLTIFYRNTLYSEKSAIYGFSFQVHTQVSSGKLSAFQYTWTWSVCVSVHKISLFDNTTFCKYWHVILIPALNDHTWCLPFLTSLSLKEGGEGEIFFLGNLLVTHVIQFKGQYLFRNVLLWFQKMV